MSKFYDDGTSKAWHPQRFRSYWAPKGRTPSSARAAEAQGFKLSLWLCCDYDLGVYGQLLSGQGAVGRKAGRQAAAGVNVVDGFEDQRSANRRRRKGATRRRASRRPSSRGSSI